MLFDYFPDRSCDSFHTVAKKKPKPFRAVKAVKSAARDTIGAPPPTRRAPDITKEQREKHKPTLTKLLNEEP